MTALDRLLSLGNVWRGVMAAVAAAFFGAAVVCWRHPPYLGPWQDRGREKVR